MKVCCGGILGLGESEEQRVELAETLRELDVDSVPLNFLNPIQGTPLEEHRSLTPMDCLRAITMFRYFLPDKPISICGEMGHDPAMIPFLLGIGIRRLSVDPQFLPVLQRAISAMSVTRAEEYARQLLAASTFVQIEQLKKEWAWGRDGA